MTTERGAADSDATPDPPVAGSDGGGPDGGGPDGGGPAARWWGLLLSALLVGHLASLFVLHGGVYRLDWNILAARWADLPWRLWDLALVVVGCGYGGAVLAGWVKGRTDRRIPAACYALALTATLVAGVVAVVTFEVDLR